MKPLLSVISYNRVKETMATIRSLKATGAFDEAEVVVWDNGSVDETPCDLRALVKGGFLDWDRVFLNQENIGCPRALNQILYTWRKPGQHFIKVDNDVILETKGWIGKLVQFLEEQPMVAMAGPWYEGLENSGRLRNQHDGWYELFPIVGHCVIHRGPFLDRTGFFDVLAEDHLYGFEDNLMAHRAAAMGLKCAVVTDTTMRNIQRHNSLDNGCGSVHTGEDSKQHVDRLRPEYECRVRQIWALKGRYHTSADGQE